MKTLQFESRNSPEYFVESTWHNPALPNRHQFNTYTNLEQEILRRIALLDHGELDYKPIQSRLISTAYYKQTYNLWIRKQGIYLLSSHIL